MSRREKVEKLIAQALQDRRPHKYIQGGFILAELDARSAAAQTQRNIFINSIRQK